MNDKLKELEEKIRLIDDEYQTAMELLNKYKKQSNILQDKKHFLEKEKAKLESQLQFDNILEKFLLNNKGFKYFKKSEHSCRKCRENLELFTCHTGIGIVEVGVCPKCECEIDISDYANW